MKPLSFFALITTSIYLTVTACTQTPVIPTQPIKSPAKPSVKPKIALVLGGGGAKGFAHVGVIKVLEKNGITPDLIVGTSSGSLVGSLYASGKSASEIEDIATHVRNNELLDYSWSKQGFIEGIKLQNWVNTQVDNQPIEKLPIRFASVATDLTTKQKAVFDKGNTGLAVRASSSVYGVFVPPRINNKRYGDGGLTSLVPVQTAKQMGADIIIAVDVSSPPKNSHPQDFWALLDKTFAVIPNQANAAEIKWADVVIHPAVGDIGTTNTIAREATIKAGEIATLAKLSDIEQKIGKFQKL